MTTMRTFPLTVRQYHEMIRCGILTENDRCELIRGRLVPKMTIGDDHAACVDLLNRLLNKRVPEDIGVRVQNPVVLLDSEPEPDISLVRLIGGKPKNKKPLPADVLLIIEVADSSYDFDRQEKLPLYAENGIPEYWIIDLAQSAVEVFRTPQGSDYLYESRLSGGDSVTLSTLPQVTLTVAELLDFS